MNLTFKLTDETKINWLGETLFRIEAVVDIPARGVKKGDKAVAYRKLLEEEVEV